MFAYIPRTAIESARCPSWSEAAHAAEFLDGFLYRNANLHPHEWICYQPSPVRPGLPWVVYTIPEQFSPLADRMPVKTCGQCGAPHGTCSHTRPIPTSGTAVRDGR